MFGGSSNDFGIRQFVQIENDALVMNDNEEILYELEKVDLAFRNNINDVIPGMHLYVTNQRIVLTGSDSCFEIDVPYIGLHAVSRDVSSFPKPCLYCQLNQDQDNFGDDNENDNNNDNDNDSTKPGVMFSPEEVFIVPSDDSLLQALFEAFSKAAMLNPDPDEPGDEEFGEDADELFYNVDEVEYGAKQAQALAHWDSLLTEPPLENKNNNNVDEDDRPTKKK